MTRLIEMYILILEAKVFYLLFYRFFSQQVRVGGRNKNKNKIHSDHFLKSKETQLCFILPSAVTGGNLINLAAIEKTKRKNITELHESEGNKKIKLKKNIFFFKFQKLGSGGSVKRKIKKLWPEVSDGQRFGITLQNKIRLFFYCFAIL